MEEKIIEAEQESDIKQLEADNLKIRGILEERKKLLDEKEKVLSRDKMGGKSEMTPPPAKKVISPKEYANALLQGKILKEE